MDLTDVSTQVDPENDEVFISGLPLTGVTEQDIADHFGQIGIIKQVRWLYMSIVSYLERERVP